MSDANNSMDSFTLDDVDATVGIMVWPGPAGQLFITGFMEGTSAENCGLQEEDVITAVDGERITDLPAAEASHLLSGTLNSAVTVTVLRGQGSSASSHTVALVRDVSIDVAVPTDADVGVMVWPGANGTLVITGLKEDSSAMASGLQPGDVLTMVDGFDVLQHPAAQISKMLSGPAGSEVTLTVSRMQDGLPTTVCVTLTRDVYIEAIGAVITEGGVMAMTKAQKQMEDVLFGPFARMKLAEVPEPAELWDMLSKYVSSVGGTGKIGVQVFTQFVHWLSMQLLSKAAETAGDQFGSFLIAPNGTPLASPAGCFTFLADTLDIIVPSICPDLFRFLDHNQDGDLSKEEWLKLVSLMQRAGEGDMGPGFEREVLDFIFTVMDKDNSKTLELSEVTDFMLKIISIAFDVTRAAIKTLAVAAEKAAEQDAVEQAFAILDVDHDGCLVPDEVFAGFPSELLRAVKTIPAVVESCGTLSASSSHPYISKFRPTFVSFVRGVREFVGQTTRLGTRDFFYTKVKESISSALLVDLKQFDIVFPPELLAAQVRELNFRVHCCSTYGNLILCCLLSLTCS
jgi:Ca2+-binding EF-hand superfamily protein